MLPLSILPSLSRLALINLIELSIKGSYSDRGSILVGVFTHVWVLLIYIVRWLNVLLTPIRPLGLPHRIECLFHVNYYVA